MIDIISKYRAGSLKDDSYVYNSSSTPPVSQWMPVRDSTVQMALGSHAKELVTQPAMPMAPSPLTSASAPTRQRHIFLVGQQVSVIRDAALRDWTDAVISKTPAETRTGQYMVTVLGVDYPRDESDIKAKTDQMQAGQRVQITGGVSQGKYATIMNVMPGSTVAVKTDSGTQAWKSFAEVRLATVVASSPSVGVLFSTVDPSPPAPTISSSQMWEVFLSDQNKWVELSSTVSQKLNSYGKANYKRGAQLYTLDANTMRQTNNQSSQQRQIRRKNQTPIVKPPPTSSNPTDGGRWQVYLDDKMTYADLPLNVSRALDTTGTSSYNRGTNTYDVVKTDVGIGEQINRTTKVKRKLKRTTPPPTTHMGGYTPIPSTTIPSPGGIWELWLSDKRQWVDLDAQVSASLNSTGKGTYKNRFGSYILTADLSAGKGWQRLNSKNAKAPRKIRLKGTGSQGPSCGGWPQPQSIPGGKDDIKTDTSYKTPHGGIPIPSYSASAYHPVPVLAPPPTSKWQVCIDDKNDKWVDLPDRVSNELSDDAGGESLYHEDAKSYMCDASTKMRTQTSRGPGHNTQSWIRFHAPGKTGGKEPSCPYGDNCTYLLCWKSHPLGEDRVGLSGKAGEVITFPKHHWNKKSGLQLEVMQGKAAFLPYHGKPQTVSIPCGDCGGRYDNGIGVRGKGCKWCYKSGWKRSEVTCIKCKTIKDGFCNWCDGTTKVTIDTLLRHSCRHRDNANEVKRLITMRADVNAYGPNGSSALNSATHWSNPGVLKLLKRAKASVSLLKKYGDVAKSVGVKTGHIIPKRTWIYAGTTVVQDQALQYVDQKAKIASQKARPKLQALLKVSNSDMDVLAEYIKTTVPLTVNLDPTQVINNTYLCDLLAVQGRYKHQFEVDLDTGGTYNPSTGQTDGGAGGGRGSNNKKARRGWEVVFGPSYDGRDLERPLYGNMNLFKDPAGGMGSCPQYGVSYYELSSYVRHRCTIADADTSHKGVIVGNLEHSFHVLLGAYEKIGKCDRYNCKFKCADPAGYQQHYLRMLKDIINIYNPAGMAVRVRKIVTNVLHQYIEVHIHGQVNMSRDVYKFVLSNEKDFDQIMLKFRTRFPNIKIWKHKGGTRAHHKIKTVILKNDSDSDSSSTDGWS